MSEFGCLVEQEIPRLRRYARALTRNLDRADDLVQDTLVRAISKSHLWQDGTNLRAWLFTIMHNQHVNSVRRSLRELERALGQLPAGQRQVVLLVGLEGMTYDEAAKILHVPIGTVRSRLAR